MRLCIEVQVRPLERRRSVRRHHGRLAPDCVWRLRGYFGTKFDPSISLHFCAEAKHNSITHQHLCNILPCYVLHVPALDQTSNSFSKTEQRARRLWIHLHFPSSPTTSNVVPASSPSSSSTLLCTPFSLSGAVTYRIVHLFKFPSLVDVSSQLSTGARIGGGEPSSFHGCSFRGFR